MNHRHTALLRNKKAGDLDTYCYLDFMFVILNVRSKRYKYTDGL